MCHSGCDVVQAEVMVIPLAKDHHSPGIVVGFVQAALGGVTLCCHRNASLVGSPCSRSGVPGSRSEHFQTSFATELLRLHWLLRHVDAPRLPCAAAFDIAPPP